MENAGICPFCVLNSGKDLIKIESKKSDIFYEDDLALGFISAGWWPNNPGSALVIPRQHFKNVYDIPADIYAHINEVGRRIALAMKQAYACEGISFRQHNEEAGGQSVSHFHLWIFPRYTNDRLYELYSSGKIVPIENRLKYANKLKSYFS